MKTVADEVASKYQMGFPAVVTPTMSTPATQPESGVVLATAEPVAATPPVRTQDAETGRITFAEPAKGAQPVLGAEKSDTDKLAAVEKRAAESARAFKAAMCEVVRLTTLARHSSTNEAAEHVTTIEKFAQSVLRNIEAK